MTKSHEQILQDIHAGIDMPIEVYEEIIAKYQSIGTWLHRDGSTISEFDPFVAPQGSVLLGTANRPIGATCEYDVDLICRLATTKADVTQKALKLLVGGELIAYAQSVGLKKSPKNNRRCWTLEYQDDRRFHVDVLPCLPDTEGYRARLLEGGFRTIAEDTSIAEKAVAITDDTHPDYEILSDDWPSSNPLGYAEWFRQRMAERVFAAKRALAESTAIYASIEDVPDHKVKTTLQKAIQLLKRHRDMTFSDDPDLKPISIIISTLAALAYNNETTLVAALTSILDDMDDFIEDRNGVYWIANPVNPNENFADKWEDEPKKARAFRNWLNDARRDFGEYLNVRRPHEIPTTLKDRLGKSVVEAVVPPVPEKTPVVLGPAVIRSRNDDRTNAMVERVRERGTGTQPWYGKLE